MELHPGDLSRAQESLDPDSEGHVRRHDFMSYCTKVQAWQRPRTLGREEVFDLWASIDPNGEGHASVAKVGPLMEKMWARMGLPPLSPEDIATVAAELDPIGRGVIWHEDFRVFVATTQRTARAAVAAADRADSSEYAASAAQDRLRSEVNSELNFPPNFEGLVLGCIDADFCK